MHRSLPAVLAFVVTLVTLLPPARTLPQHGDEKMYAWKASHYWNRLVNLDFRPAGPDQYREPGFSPYVFWAVEQPLGSHLIYAVAMAATRMPPPPLPELGDAAHQDTTTAIPAATLIVVRLTAILCAAFGFALIAWRLGYPGLLPLLMLALPHVPADLARAWAEGPLLLGIGLGVRTYGTRWFPVVAGMAASFKLTALLMWPVVFLKSPLGHSRYGHVLAVGVSALTWALLTPTSWFAGGPAYLTTLLGTRFAQFASQSRVVGTSAEYEGFAGLFWPSRYWLPIELGIGLLLAWAIRRAWERWLASASPVALSTPWGWRP